MPKQRQMKKEARHELVMSYRQEYMSVPRARRGKILDTLEEPTGYNRKYLIRLLSSKYKPHARQKHRGKIYGGALDDVLRVIFRAHDGVSPERLRPNLLSVAQQLEANGELALTPELEEQLQRISVPTLRRIRSRLR